MLSMSSKRANYRYWVRLALFTGIVSGIAGLGLLVYLVDRQLDVLLAPVRQPITRTPANLGLPYQDITLTSRDGLKVAGWYIPGARPQGIILIHGVNANRMAMLPTAALLAEAGFHLLLLDLRGHGESGESLNSYGYYEALDAQVGADYLSALPEVERIGVLGVSLGGAAVARAAAEDSRLQAVVIQTSYSSLPAAVDDAFETMTIFPKRPFAPLIVALAERRVEITIDQVDSARDLATLSPRAVLIIHAANDHLFPVEHALKMYNVAGEPKELWIIEDFGHGDPAIAREDEYRARVVGFFEKAFTR
jgi:dipeptidyl aminopeptidase/acylaminoacyl peptidase